MPFLFPSLLWIGVPLLAATVALHLLNFRRERRIPWGAMEFLLESEQINRTWLRLKQLLLMAVRLAIILLAVMMFARPMLRASSSAWWRAGGVLTLVVLDDSFSMTDRGPNASAWEEALAALERLVERARQERGARVVVIRSSQAEQSSGDTPIHPAADAEGGQELSHLLARLEQWEASVSAPDVRGALERSAQFVRGLSSGVVVAAYVLTDARQTDVEPSDRYIESLEQLREQVASLQVIDCAAAWRKNLALTDLSIRPGPLASGVELSLSVAVINYGPTPAVDVVVELAHAGRRLPAVEMGEIKPGESAVRRVPIRFQDIGSQKLQAKLDADAIECDNVRYCVAKVRAERTVLIVDGSKEGREGLAFAKALKPHPRFQTGWRPMVVASERLKVLDEGEEVVAVLLLDVARLNRAALQGVLQHVQSGGGLFVSLGPTTDQRFYNEHLFGHRQGTLLPIQIEPPLKAPVVKDSGAGDLLVQDHPLFRVFSGDRNSFLNFVAVDYHFGIVASRDGVSASVIAHHRSGAPLIVENKLGRGPVVCLLTTVAQERDSRASWSNLSVLPIFPVLANELVAYLAAPRLRGRSLLVAEPWGIGESSINPELTARLSAVSLQGESLDVRNLSANEIAADRGPDVPGFWRMELLKAGKIIRTIECAANVESKEGATRLFPRQELGRILAGKDIPIRPAESFLVSRAHGGNPLLATLFAACLLASLVGEQFLGYAWSHHDPFSGAKL